MGRPRKVQNSRSRSFLLPGDVLDRLEEAARLRGVEVSDVVRDILEKQISPYLSESKRAHRQRMKSIIAEVSQDPELAENFERNKGQKDFALVSEISVAKYHLLTKALKAYRELEGDDKQWHSPLLREVAARRVGQLERIVRDLDDCYGTSRDAFDVRKIEGEHWLLLGQQLAMDIKNKEKSSALAKIVGGLIREGDLVRDREIEQRPAYRFRISRSGN